MHYAVLHRLACFTKTIIQKQKVKFDNPPGRSIRCQVANYFPTVNLDTLM